MPDIMLLLSCLSQTLDKTSVRRLTRIPSARILLYKDTGWLLAGDEVVVTKSGKQTYGLGRFFSSLHGKAVPGLYNGPENGLEGEG